MGKKGVPQKSKIDWIMIKEEWFESHLQKRGLNFRQLAERNNISWQQVRNKASTEGWTEQLEKRLAAYDLEVAERMKHARTAVTEKLQEEFIGNEFEIRKRHAQVSRGIQGKALQRISSIPIEEMKLSDAIALLKLGMEEERRALGMPNDYVAPSEAGKLHPEFKSVADQEKDHAKIAKAAGRLLEILRRSPINSADDLRKATEALGVSKPGDHAKDITPPSEEPVLRLEQPQPQ